MRTTVFLIPYLLAVGSCSSLPKPPTVDESQKRPANAAIAVELQTCKGELQNTRILANESAREAEAGRAAAARLEQYQRVASLRAAPTPVPRNTVYSVLFPFGSASIVVPAADATGLIEQARIAPLIMLRGRTDGGTETPAESRVASERAAAVRGYLVQAGVDPTRIRTTYQPVGDHAADNVSADGRALNRRVEIEIYRALPQLASIAQAPPQ